MKPGSLSLYRSARPPWLRASANRLVVLIGLVLAHSAATEPAISITGAGGRRLLNRTGTHPHPHAHHVPVAHLPTPRFKVVTVTSEENENVRRLEGSWPWGVRVLGLGLTPFVRYVSKMQTLWHFLRFSVDDKDMLIMYVDHDVAFLPQCGRDLYDEFLSFGTDLVISTDKKCYPAGPGSGRCCYCNADRAAEHPGAADQPYRFVNAGALMGKAKHILHYLETDFFSVNATASPPTVSPKGEFDDGIGGDDQLVWASIFLSKYGSKAHRPINGEPTIALDTGGQIWHSTSESILEEDYIFPSQRGGVYQKYFKKETCIMHANALTREFFWRIEEKYPFMFVPLRAPHVLVPDLYAAERQHQFAEAAS